MDPGNRILKVHSVWGSVCCKQKPPSLAAESDHGNICPVSAVKGLAAAELGSRAPRGHCQMSGRATVVRSLAEAGNLSLTWLGSQCPAQAGGLSSSPTAGPLHGPLSVLSHGGWPPASPRASAPTQSKEETAVSCESHTCHFCNILLVTLVILSNLGWKTRA